MASETKVLVLSSDARVREPATEILLRNGFVVDEAQDAAAAMRVVGSERPPQVVLVDTATVGRPRMKGFLDRLGGALGDRGVRVVLLAGDATTEAVRRHPAVGYVIETPAAVRSLMAVSDWLERAEESRLRPVTRSVTSVGSRRHVG